MSSGTLDDGGYLDDVDLMTSYSILSDVVPFLRAGGTPTVHRPVSRQLCLLCTNYRGFLLLFESMRST